MSHAARLDLGPVVYAVGDIHGRLDLLRAFTRTVVGAAAGERATVVFLGDYIDRGPDTRGVISHLISLNDESAGGAVFLRGNHEQLMLDLIDGQAPETSWLDHGGLETLRSYGVDWPPAKGPRSLTHLAQAIIEAVPEDHLRFLRDTRLIAQWGAYLFVHAGLRPDRLLSEQSDVDMLWYRQQGDAQPVHGRTVVHGHSPGPRPVAGRWRIGLDTEAYASGALTALRLEGEERIFLKIHAGRDGAPPTIGAWEAIDRPEERRPTRPRPASTGLLGGWLRRLAGREAHTEDIRG